MDIAPRKATKSHLQAGMMRCELKPHAQRVQECFSLAFISDMKPKRLMTMRQ
jgi:hypothetical protein